MSMIFNPGLIPTNTLSSNSINNSYNSTDLQSARGMGPITPYQFKSLKTKKQLKELKIVLLPQKKKFLFLNCSFAFNVKESLAEKHGLEFRKYIPKPKMPTLNRGPIKDLRPQDITSLIAIGWAIQPPQGTKETPVEQYSRLMFEIQGKLNQIQNIIPMMEVEENG